MNKGAPLLDLMIQALREIRDINNIGARVVAYVRAGISMKDISYEEIVRDDLLAHSTELARRLNDAPTERRGGASACDA
jgi:hypothetical protein